MKKDKIKILVFFVEVKTYILDLIHEVYENTPWEYQYVFESDIIAEEDRCFMPQNYTICGHDCRKIVRSVFDKTGPDFAIINGYYGRMQTAAIRQCRRKNIPYAIEADTPLNIPSNPLKAQMKKIYLSKKLRNALCYGFAGGTLQQENLEYYGIARDHCYLMPMSVSMKNIDKILERLPSKDELKREHGIGEKYLILYVGRFVGVKNISLLIDAFSELFSERKDVALILVGDGPEHENLKRQAHNPAVGNVYFMGYNTGEKLIEYYKMADIFVLPSCYEPWGLVVNEAMTCRLPVVVSSVVGCRRDLVKEGYNGYIFEDGKAKDMYCKLKMILDSGDYSRLGGNGRKIMERWNFATYKGSFIDAVEEICGR